MVKRILLTAILAATALTPNVRGGAIVLTDGTTIAGTVLLVGPNDAKISVAAVGKATKTYKYSDVKEALFDARVGDSTSREADGVPWSRTEVGDSKKAGVAEINGTRISIKDGSDGFKIGRQRRAEDAAPNDSCCFVFQQLQGDGEIIAKVLPGENTRWMRAGLMICEGLDGTGPMVLLSRTADPVFATLLFRIRAGETISTTPDAKNENVPGSWLKLTRTGSSIKAYESYDGVKWIPLTAEKGAPLNRNIVMDDKKGVYIGVCATGNSREGTAQFESIRLSGKRAVPALIGVGDSRLPDSSLALQDGTVFAGKLESIDKNNQAQFKRAGADGQTMAIPVSALARAQFEALTRGQTEKLMASTTGVLTRDGDFLDGDIKELNEKSVTVSSISLGLTTLERPRVLGVIFPLPAAGAVATDLTAIRLSDGSVIVGRNLTVDNADLTIDEPLIGKWKVPLKEVVSIEKKAG